MFVFVTGTAHADPIAVGDLIRFTGSAGTLGGGAFSVDNLSTGPGVDFLTFCLQMTQHIDYSQSFRVGGITNFADDAGGPDPISLETAWIFSSFRSGSLSSYGSNEIQAAIWVLEDEWTTDVGNSAALITLAHNQVNAGWVNNGVGVLNLFYTDGQQAQDQLTLNPPTSQLPPEPVPEPGTLSLMGVAGAALAAARKKFRRR